jgi:hypothetical protein
MVKRNNTGLMQWQGRKLEDGENRTSGNKTYLRTDGTEIYLIY